MTTDRLLSLANGAYLLCVIFAALFSVVLWRLSIRASEEANVQISAADSRAAEANKLAADAGRDAARANERAAALENKAAEAKERTTQAEERIANLNAQIANMVTPRTIPVEERRYFVLAMEEAKGASFIGASNPGDPESLFLLISIMDILQEAGWDGKNWTAGGSVTSIPGYPNVGQYTTFDVRIFHRSDGDFRLLRSAGSMQLCLEKAGIKVTSRYILPEERIEYPGFSDPSALYILVGKKNF